MRPNFVMNRRRTTPPHGGLVLVRWPSEDTQHEHIHRHKKRLKATYIVVKRFTWANMGKRYPYNSAKRGARTLSAAA